MAADLKKAATKDTTAKAATTAEAAVAAKKTEAPVAAEKTTAEKESAKKAETKKAPAKRGRKPGSTVKKADKAGKKSGKKAAPAERTTQVHVQIEGRDDIVTNDIIEKIEEAFKAEGHRVSTIKDLQVYLNVGEHKAYYVINGKADGKFVEL